MTEHPESIQEALDDNHVTLALTPAHLLLLVVGIYLLIRFLRGMRS